jgi:hypothetical protein
MLNTVLAKQVVYLVRIVAICRVAMAVHDRVVVVQQIATVILLEEVVCALHCARFALF